MTCFVKSLFRFTFTITNRTRT